MDRVAYLINSTPKYYYILELHLVLLRRYAPTLKWQVFLATEEPNHPVCKRLVAYYDVKLLVLEKEYSSFLSSRKRAIELLPPEVLIVLPMQEDFLLERFVDDDALMRYVDYFDGDPRLFSIRLMPCPGPHETNESYSELLRITEINDTYGFTFQASLWKRSYLQEWYDAIVEKCNEYPNIDKKKLEVDINIAENSDGQKLYYSLFKNKIVAGVKRVHKYPNAVYMCPWPYRPTAIIKGVLQPFAKMLAEREGVVLEGVS
jgi:hypothetical protein